MITWHRFCDKVNHNKRKIEKFIKELSHKLNLAVKGFIISRQLWLKSWKLIIRCGEIAFTGIIVHYTLTHFNWLSSGLAIALIMFYIEWFVKLVKNKETK